MGAKQHFLLVFLLWSATFAHAAKTQISNASRTTALPAPAGLTGFILVYFNRDYLGPSLSLQINFPDPPR
jgi:hypothetical protein